MAHKKVVIGNATLYWGDCVEVLQNGIGQVDIVVTSPRYNTLHHPPQGSGLFKNNKWIKRSAKAYPDKTDEREYQRWLRTVFDLAEKKTKGLMWVNHKVRFRNKAGIHPLRMLPYPLWSEVIWDRGRSMALNANRFAPSHEGVYGFGVPHYWNELENNRLSVWRISPTSDPIHPCPFPRALVEPLILASCPRGGIVLDLMMGVGTAGLVALALDRKFVGIEKEKKFFDKACRSIERFYLKKRW